MIQHGAAGKGIGFGNFIVLPEWTNPVFQDKYSS
jgi:hypothetical protein